MDIELCDIGWIKTLIASHWCSRTVTVEIFVKAWSVYENRVTNGISHFLEHMFFKWWKKYPTSQEVAKTVDSFWWNFNAFTWEEYVGYYITCASPYLYIALDVLADMLVNPQFSSADVDEEKKVVLQELKMWQDNPRRVANIEWIKWYYGDNSYGRSTIWPEQNIISSFTHDMLVEYKTSLYTKDNLVITVAWLIEDTHLLKEKIGELFQDLPAEKTAVKPPYPFHVPAEHEKSKRIGTNSNHVIIGADGYGMYDPRRFAWRLLAVILWGYRTSRLFQEIRERNGLTYYVSAYHFENENTGTFKILAWVSKERREEWLAAIYWSLEEISERSITEEEMVRALNYMTWITEMWLETSSQIAWFLGPQVLFTGKYMLLNDILGCYQWVTIQDIQEAAARLRREFLYTYRVY